MSKIVLFVASLCFASIGQAAEIFYCRAYSGATFWTSAPCAQQQGLVEKVVIVPDGIPFEQQVALGRQQLAPENRPMEIHGTPAIPNGAPLTRSQASPRWMLG